MLNLLAEQRIRETLPLGPSIAAALGLVGLRSIVRNPMAGATQSAERLLFFDELLALAFCRFDMTLVSIMGQARPAARTFDKAIRRSRTVEPGAEAVGTYWHVNCVPDVIVTEYITGRDDFRNSANIAHIVSRHR